MQHFHQITLRVHHFVDVLVGHRNLIDDRRILAALDMSSRADLVCNGEGIFGFGAAHGPTGTVAARAERLLVAETANDEAFGAHGAGNDPQFALLRRHRPFAGDQNVFTEVPLFLHVIVVAVHSLQRDLEGRSEEHTSELQSR